MTNTITLTDLESIAGVTASKWERNGKTRHYLNVPGAAYKLYWVGNDEGGKAHFALTRGRSTPDAEAVARAVLGCAVTSRYSSAAPYVVVEG